MRTQPFSPGVCPGTQPFNTTVECAILYRIRLCQTILTPEVLDECLTLYHFKSALGTI